MKRMAIALLALTATGCTLPNAATPDEQPSIVGFVRYERDPRTQVCFALLKSTTYAGYEAISIAAVPDAACKKAGVK